MAEGGEVDGIGQVYRDYVDTFNTGDGAAMARLIGYPFAGSKGGEIPSVVPDAPAYAKMIEGAIAHFKTRGWVRSQIDRLDAVATGGDTGVISADFSRWRGDGSLIERDSGHYITRRIDGEWKIVAAIMA